MIALSEGIGILEEGDMVNLAHCNVGRINLDFFDRAMDMDALVCCWYDLFGQDCTPGISLEAECPADDQRVAMQTFGYSIVYLMGLFACLLIDHYIPAVLTLLQ